MGNIRRMTRKRLGELLLQEGLVNEERLEQALEEQQQTGELVGEILVRKGFVTESDVARTISTQFSFPYLSVSRYYIAPEMVKLFSLEEIEKNCFVPIDRFGEVLSIVVAGLLDQDVMDDIEKRTKSTLQIYVGTVSEVKQVIKEKFANIPGPSAKPKGAPEAADVTAPPAAHASAKKAPAEAQTTTLTEAEANEDVAGPPDGDAAPTDDSVVKELEEQFKKFRFFEGEAKDGKKEEKK
jgi:type IV pilus assembly protein PilB